MLSVCKFGNKCTRANCKFNHSNKQPCKFGNKCNRSDCKYVHPKVEKFVFNDTYYNNVIQKRERIEGLNPSEYLNQPRFDYIFEHIENKVFKRYWKNGVSNDNLLNKRNKHLFVKCFIHSSYSIDNNDLNTNYERIEFLGDIELNLMIKKWVYTKFASYTPFILTSVDSYMKSTKFLSKIYDLLDFEKVIIKKKDILTTDKMKEDIVEAFFHAVYTNIGYDRSKCLVNNLLNELIDGKYDDLIKISIKKKQILNEKIFEQYKTPMKDIIKFEIKQDKKTKLFNCLSYSIGSQKFSLQGYVFENLNKNELIEEVSGYILVNNF